MKIDILTLFPKMFEGPFRESIMGRVRSKGIVRIEVHDLRKFTRDRHRQADDRPYGGGPGMVMKPEPLFEAVEYITGRKTSQLRNQGVRVILMSPQGKTFIQEKARELAGEKQLILICGHYEGIDERAGKKLATDELSLGDYVLTGGELAAMVVVDAVVRLLPGALGAEESVKKDSFSEELLDCPHYTRPAVYREMKVPEVLLSGNHGEIEKWRRQEALRQTFLRRPDLIEKADLSEEERKFLRRLRRKVKGS
ncbi:tRNA (guanosine(37)-N1)-methyltransferase TrmD [candidate division NPL-UPA2 bacterium]|nr:tRNA (guanosine(37)-N1)-methyltransferase TrmD [candidate division NPL-UPA2 bacterium]